MTSLKLVLVAVLLVGAASAPAAAQVRSDSEIKECMHGIEVAKRHHANPSLPGTGPDAIAHPLRTQCYRRAMAQLRAQDGDLFTQTLRARAADEKARSDYFAALREASDTRNYDAWRRGIEMDSALSNLDRAAQNLRQ